MNRRGLAAVLLLVCLFAQTMAHARAASITFDEGPHLAIGYATLRTGDLRLQPVHIHPPLANVLAAAPLLLQADLPDPRTITGWEIDSLSAITDAVVWQYPHPRRLALACPLPHHPDDAAPGRDHLSLGRRSLRAKGWPPGIVPLRL